MRADVLDAVKLARSNAESVPINEADTCFRIVCPLLLGVGYAYGEILSQGTDSAGQKPDYTILPNEPSSTWFLEAKAWSVSLQDVHAQQAVNYANTQGKRWVVLTNGQEWRLYDNHINGTVNEMLAATAYLDHESFASFAEAISRQSVTSGKLEQYVRNQRLFNYLGGQLARLDSEVVLAIRKVLRKQPGLDDVAAADITRYFQSGHSSPGVPADVAKPVVAPTDGKALPVETVVPVVSFGPDGRTLRLSDVAKSDVTFKKPVSVRLASGETKPLRNWNDLVIGAAKLAIRCGGLQHVPVRFNEKSKTAIIALSGTPEASRMREYKTVETDGKTYVVECNYCAMDCVSACIKILGASGMSPDDCFLTIKA